MPRSMTRTLPCPNCGSERTKRGGPLVWTVYLALIALAVPAVLVFELNAAIVGGIIIAVVVIAHLALNQRVCLDCGRHWRDDKLR
jgi:hypothetical protein